MANTHISMVSDWKRGFTSVVDILNHSQKNDVNGVECVDKGIWNGFNSLFGIVWSEELRRQFWITKRSRIEVMATNQCLQSGSTLKSEREASLVK